MLWTCILKPKKKINVTRLYVDIKLMCVLFKLNIPKVELRKLKIFKKKTHRYYEFCLLFIINIFYIRLIITFPFSFGPNWFDKKNYYLHFARLLKYNKLETKYVVIY